MKKNKKGILLFTFLLVTIIASGCAGAGHIPGSTGTQETEKEGRISVEEASSETEEESSEETRKETSMETEMGTITETMDSETQATETEQPETEDSSLTSPEEAMLLPADTVIEPTADTDAYFSILPIGDEVFARICGNSFPEDGGITTDELRYLRVLHVDFNGETRIGEIIVNTAAAEDTLAVFRELYDAGYQIRRMVLVDNYYDAGDPEFSHLERGNQADSVSIRFDNTSAFNYRVASNNANLLSNHAMGRAIDLNPLENPYVYTDGSVDGPGECLAYVDRSQASAENHMMTADDFAVLTFKNHGFSWGGDWYGDKDYQHFDYEW